MSIRPIAAVFVFTCFIGIPFLQSTFARECKEVRRNSFLWKIKRDPPAYFFGTLHVPYTKVWDRIPSASKKAFRGSDNVYFELDLTNQRTRTALTRCQMLPSGSDLREILPSDLYQRLKSHLEYVRSAMPGWLGSQQQGRGWYADSLFEAIAGNWERKRPIWVMLMVNSLTEADIKSQGVPVLDLHLASQAGRLGKRVGAIEQVDEQCQPLNGLNMSQVLYALDHSLLMQEKARLGGSTPYTKEDLIDQYNCGELDEAIFDSESSQIPKLINDTSDGGGGEHKKAMADQVDWYFRNELIYRRNKKMARRVQKLLVENPGESFFFAFGAGHFLGNGSVIDFLQKEGFEIEHSAEVEPDAADSQISSGASKHQQHRKASRKRKRSQEKRRSNGGRKTTRTRKRNNKKSKQKIRSKGRNHNQHQHQYFADSMEFLSANLPQVRVVNRYPTASPLLSDWQNAGLLEAGYYGEEDPFGGGRPQQYIWRRVNTHASDNRLLDPAIRSDVWSERYQDLLSGAAPSVLARWKRFATLASIFLALLLL